MQMFYFEHFLKKLCVCNSVFNSLLTHPYELKNLSIAAICET